MKKKIIPVNNQIRAKEVRLVSDDGEHFGVIPTTEALKKAKERELDLVQVTDNVFPPVCKIIDYGKYSYEENKRKKQQIKSSKPQVKVVRLGFSISEHDMEIRMKAIEKFLEDGNFVRLVIPLRGRQKALQSVAKEKINQCLSFLSQKIEIKIEKEISNEPKGLTVTVVKK